MNTGESRRDFRDARYWPALDGLRALSIALVVLVHTTDPLWQHIQGAVGVTLFFVISGFLITTLLLREEHRKGRVSLSGFYIRRLFRIAPLYFLVLAGASFLVLGLGVGDYNSAYLERLPLLATFNGELAGPGAFYHSWSLGIEEKFYLLWPLVAFAVVAVSRFRTVLVIGLLPVSFAANYIDGLGYLGIYFPIVAGCGLALMADSDRGYAVWKWLTRPSVAAAMFTLMVAALLADPLMPDEQYSAFAFTPFAVTAALALPGVIGSGGTLTRVFQSSALVYVGTRAYALYLVHPGVTQLLDQVIAPGQTALAPQVVRLVIIFTVSLGIAEVLHRVVEAPMIGVGRRLTRSHLPAGTVPSATPSIGYRLAQDRYSPERSET